MICWPYWPCLCLVCWSHFQEFKSRRLRPARKKGAACSVHLFFQPPETKSDHAGVAKWVFPEMGVPPVIIHFLLGFSWIFPIWNHPAMGVPPLEETPPNRSIRKHQDSTPGPWLLRRRIRTASAAGCAAVQQRRPQGDSHGAGGISTRLWWWNCLYKTMPGWNCWEMAI